MREGREEEKEMRKNNKGFSLVELIVVIAIMAILIGVVGTQVLPYIEKSRVSKDEQVISALLTDAVSAYAMAATDAYTTGAKITSKTTTDTLDPIAATAFLDQLKELKGITSGSIFDKVHPTLESKKYKGAAVDNIVISQDPATGIVTVSMQKAAVVVGSMSSK